MQMNTHLQEHYHNSRYELLALLCFSFVKLEVDISYLIQVLWKNIKISLKKTAAEARRERFKTGGGPAHKDPDQVDELLTGIMESQQPLENIPDDDHIDSSDDGSQTPTLGKFIHFILPLFSKI